MVKGRHTLSGEASPTPCLPEPAEQGYANERKAPWRGGVKGPAVRPLETYPRQEIQGWLQDLLEHEVQEFLGREKSVSKTVADDQPGFRVDTHY